MWEEPGSWYKNQGDGILGFWEPVTPGEEPGSQFKIYKENNFFCGNRFPVWRNRVPHTKFQERVIFRLWEPGSPREEPVTIVLNTKMFKTSKIHIVQTVTPIRVPFPTVFLKLKILSYKIRKILFYGIYFKKSRTPDFVNFDNWELV